MAVAAVGSSSPSRSNRRHVQKSRASRTSARVRSDRSAVGGQRCGELVGKLVEPGVGGALQEFVEGGDRGPVPLDPLRHRRGLPIPAVVAKQGGAEPVGGLVVGQRGSQVGQRVQLYPPRLAGAEQGGVLGEVVVDGEALNPGSSRDLGDGRPRGPTSRCRSTVACTIRSRVCRWASARAFSSYLRFSVDMLFIDDTVSQRSVQAPFIERGRPWYPRAHGSSDPTTARRGVSARWACDS